MSERLYGVRDEGMKHRSRWSDLKVGNAASGPRSQAEDA